MNITVTLANVKDVLDQYAGSQTPGLQYTVVDSNYTNFEYAVGWADLQNCKPVQPDTTIMAYSNTKSITAVAVRQLVDPEKPGT